VTLTPIPDWSGSVTLTFYANDSEYEITDTMTLTVLPVNDAPFGATITIETWDYIEGKAQPAFGNASDVDIPFEDELTYNWYSDVSGWIGTGQEIDLSLPARTHTITLTVTDSEEAWCNTTLEITILEDKNITTVDDDTTDDDDDDEEVEEGFFSRFWWLFVVLVFVMVVILVIVLVFILRKRSVEQEEGIPPVLPAGVSGEEEEITIEPDLQHPEEMRDDLQHEVLDETEKLETSQLTEMSGTSQLAGVDMEVTVQEE
jgi:hypothetical protein